jgi:hypothetical protein
VLALTLVLPVVGVAVLTGATVAAGVLTGVLLVFVLLALALALFAGASPHAIPKAARPRTVESAITFFILIKTPIFLKE